MHTVFVYGSLMRGYGNHGLLEESTYLGRASVEKLSLHSLGSFPAAIPSDRDDSVVHGEVYSVDDSTLARLDRLEGHPTFYERQVVELQGLEKVATNVSMYVYQGEVSRHCPSGDWRDYHATRRASAIV